MKLSPEHLAEIKANADGIVGWINNGNPPFDPIGLLIKDAILSVHAAGDFCVVVSLFCAMSIRDEVGSDGLYAILRSSADVVNRQASEMIRNN